MMERVIRFFSILLLAACAATACDLQLDPGNLNDMSVNLQLVCTDPQVKATEPGEDAYKENTINYVDYFVYATESGTTCLKHARVSPSEGHVSVALKELVGEGKPLAEGDNCFFFVVANWPDSFSGDESLSALLAKTVTVNDLDVATAANHSFVMDSKQLVPASVRRAGSEATVNLYRLEAKLTIEVNIPNQIESGGVVYTPDPASLQVYYLYATRRGTMNGLPMSYSALTDAYYFDYPYNRAVTVTGTATTGYVGKAAPFYTYPERWESHEISAPYFKVVLSWRSSGGAQTNKPYYYKVLLPESMNGRIDRNTIYKFIMNIGVLGSETDDAAVVIPGNYYVLDWLNGAHLGEDGPITRGKYLEIPRETYYIYGGNSIEIPVTSSHNIDVTVNSATYTNFHNPTPAQASLPSSAYSVTEDGRFSFTLTHNLVTDVTSASLDCSPYTFNLTVTNEAGLSKQVTVIQYPPVYISAEQSNGYVFINGTNNRFTSPNYKSVFDDGGLDGDEFTPDISHRDESTIDWGGGIYSVEYQNGDGASVRFSGVQSISIGNNKYVKEMGRDGILSNYDGRITVNAPSGSSYNNAVITKITIDYYNNRNAQAVNFSVASTSGYSKELWTGSATQVVITMPFVNSNRNQVSSVTVEYAYNSTPSSLGTIRSYNYGMDGGSNGNRNIYTVSVSSLSGMTSYIADPRSEAVDYPTLRQGSTTGTPLTGYRPVGSQYSDAIAPQFKIASSYGASLHRSDDGTSAPTFENAHKRCASYQENGYPAGRWRMPTDSEIRFMVYLSGNDKLPSLFYGTYWAASGKALRVDEYGNVTETSGTTRASVRCVYDSWYWGEDPVGPMQTWSGWQTN